MNTTSTLARPLIITSGEPAGIGPDLCLQLAQRGLDGPWVALADQNLLAERAAHLGWQVRLLPAPPPGAPVPVLPPGAMHVAHEPCAVPVQAGQLNPANAGYVLRLLDRALVGCQQGHYTAMVTAPVHKGVINDAGIAFTGHTEYLAEQTQTPKVVMMLVGAGLRVALVTTHLPLKDVAAAITADELKLTLQILLRDLQQRWRLPQPRVAVAGLNPHAGEQGHLGREEIDTIIPVLNDFRAQGWQVTGPHPADTMFQGALLEQSDAFLAMYHDQGLPVLKHASFGHGVNVTLGLPIVRTSVDHGTALNLAGTGQADLGSLLAAVALAQELGALGPQAV